MKRRPLLILAVVLALFVIADLALRIYFSRQDVVQMVKPRLEQALGRPVRIEAASIRTFPFAVELRGMQIANSSTSSEPLAEIDRLQLKLLLRHLIRRDLVVKSLVIQHPKLYLLQSDDGSWAHETPAKPQPVSGSSAGSPLALQIRELSIVDGRLSLKSEKAGLALDRPLEGAFRIEADRSFERIELDGWIRSRATRGAGNDSSNHWNFDFEARPHCIVDLADSSVSIENLQLQAESVVVDMAGKYRNRDGAWTGVLKTKSPQLDVAELLSLLPAHLLGSASNVQASGGGSFDLEIRSTKLAPLQLFGDVSIQNASFRSPDWPLAMHQVELEAHIENEILTLRSATLATGKSRLAVHGEIRDFLDRSLATMALKSQGSLSIEELAGVATLPVGVSLAGRAEVGLELRGGLHDPENWKLAGPLVLEDVMVESPQLGVPVELEAKLQGAGRRLEVVFGQVRAADSRAELSGFIEPGNADSARVELLCQSRDLDLDRVLPQRETGPVDPKSSGRSTTATLLPPALPLAVTIQGQVQSLRLQQATWQDLTFDFSGDATGFELSLGCGRFHKEELELHEVRGKLAGNGQRASGRLQAERGRLGRILAHRLDSPLEVQGPQLQLTQVQADAYEGKLGGRIEASLEDPARPTYQMELTADALDPGALFSDFVRSGNWITGSLDAQSRWSASGTQPEVMRQTLVASGNGTSVEGRLRNLPLLASLSTFLQLPSLSDLQYQNLKFAFQIEDGKVQLPDIALQGQDAEMTAKGFVDLAGNLDMQWGVVLSPELSQKFASKKTLGNLQSLFTNEDGRMVFDFALEGHVQRPKLRPEWSLTSKRQNVRSLAEVGLEKFLGQSVESAAQEAIDRAKDDLGKRLRQGLGGLRQPAKKDSSPH